VVFTRHLLVDLTVRFDNGDAVPLVVNGVRLALFRGRRIWMPRHLANSHMAIAYVANGSQPIELTEGLSLPPESVSQPYTFALYVDLPREAPCLDEAHFGVVSLSLGIQRLRSQCRWPIRTRPQESLSAWEPCERHCTDEAASPRGG
jgi:hypothetical protein